MSTRLGAGGERVVSRLRERLRPFLQKGIFDLRGVHWVWVLVRGLLGEEGGVFRGGRSDVWENVIGGRRLLGRGSGGTRFISLFREDACYEEVIHIILLCS